MTRMARTERDALCDLALQVGETEPTLCGGWDVKDLVVHLVLRERSPLAVGILVPQLAPVTERAMARMRERTDFPVLVERLRRGWPVPPGLGEVEERMNAVEFFVHHEDIRRARPGWEPRRLRPEEEQRLWSLVKVLGRGLVRRSAVGVVLERSDTGEQAVLKQADRSVVVRGLPGELVLFVYGRKAQARVELDGTPEDVATLTEVDLGI